MEPRILLGHKYLCKKTVVAKNNGETFYTAGKVYKCEVSSCYEPKSESFKHQCGHITNDQGNKWHAWPYDPQNHLWCNDSWTEFFEDMTK